ncbi:MAG: DUF3568 family protein [Planctomycetota bacterium]
MNRSIPALALTAVLALLPGCALFVTAAVVYGAVYTTGDDSAAVHLEVSREETFEAARAYVNRKGLLNMAHAYAGRIEGRVWDSDVTIDVEETEDGNSLVEVKARRLVGFKPDPQAARTIAEGIAARVGGDVNR